MNDEESNIFKFGAIDGDKPDDSEFPQNEYVILDIDDEEWVSTGFLVFTSHHVAIMQSIKGKDGAIPTLVLPINRVKAAGLSDGALNSHGE